LIGNVSVQKVDAEFGNIYLLLEGACGSCASSTVTMKMGIERVLKEKFGAKVNDVIQVDPEEAGEGKPTELTIEVVQAEVKRLSQAIIAMGGVVNVLSVDPIGVVEIEFRGPNKVKKGLELALLDIEFVKHVKFVS
jgi:Fe-S cluster biogenesis protein NfuA